MYRVKVGCQLSYVTSVPTPAVFMVQPPPHTRHMLANEEFHLLTATAAGLSTSFLSQVVEVPQTREELRRLIGGTRPPQAVLRFGHGWPVAASPRRESEDLLTPEPRHFDLPTIGRS